MTSFLKGGSAFIATITYVALSPVHVDLLAQQLEVPKELVRDEKRGPNRDDTYLAFVKSTADATRNAMKTGDVKGVITFNPGGTPTISMRFRMRFSGDRYLTESKPITGQLETRYDRIVVIADNTGVCEGVFSRGIKPFGCAGRLFQRDVIQRDAVTPFLLNGPLALSPALFVGQLDRFDVRRWRTVVVIEGQLASRFSIAQADLQTVGYSSS